MSTHQPQNRVHKRRVTDSSGIHSAVGADGLSHTSNHDDDDDHDGLGGVHPINFARRYSSETATSHVSFLNTIKRVQLLNRRDKYRKSRSARTISSDTDVISIGESIPLKVSFEKFQNRETSAVSAPVDEFRDGSNLAAQGGLSSYLEDEGGGEKKYEDVEDEAKMTPCVAISEMVFGKGILSYCLLAAPFAIASVYLEWDATWVFCLNFLVMIPLASILGDFTEEVALHTNETIGGLINASFGNAVEVVVAIQALLANEIRVVQASMMGSILSNLLLVLGCCFFFGGLRYKEQRFNPTSATANMGLLALSSIAMILPTPLAQYYELHDPHVLLVSRAAAICLLSMYIQLLIFQLKTHAYLFNNTKAPPTAQGNNTNAAGDGNGAAAQNDNDDNHEDEEELPAISFGTALAGLLLTTLLVTVFSEYLVGSIDGFVASSGISRTFVGIVLLPIVGNAVEHVAAVQVAMKNKMDLAMGVAIGSCTQISLFVVPLTVLIGWAFGRDMTLNFPQFEVVLFIMSVFTVSVVLSNPVCNWLEGSLLITTYVLVAVGFWFEKVQDFGPAKA